MAISEMKQANTATIRLTLPWPISANRYWRVWRNRAVRTQEAEAYKQEVGWLCATAGIKPLTGNICVSLDFHRPAKRGDLDNMLKVVFDSLNGWAYEDDKQIVEIHAMRFEGKDDPRVEISIREIP